MHFPEPLQPSFAASSSEAPRRAWRRRVGALLQRLERRLGVSTLKLFRAELPPAAGAEEGPLAIRFLDAAEVVAAAAEADLDLHPAWARGASSRGDRCLAAFVDGRLAGYVWVCRGKALEDEGVAMQIADDAQYLFKTFVRPAFRGRGIAPHLYGAAGRLGGAEGVTHSLLCITPYNGASAAAARRAGARAVGLVVVWRFAGRSRSWRSRGAARSLHLPS